MKGKCMPERLRTHVRGGEVANTNKNKNDCTIRKRSFATSGRFKILKNLIRRMTMLRSIKQACDLIRKEDPDSAITAYMIRLWCKENKIKSLNVGTKILVNYESLVSYISMA